MVLVDIPPKQRLLAFHDESAYSSERTITCLALCSFSLVEKMVVFALILPRKAMASLQQQCGWLDWCVFVLIVEDSEPVSQA